MSRINSSFCLKIREKVGLKSIVVVTSSFPLGRSGWVILGLMSVWIKLNLCLFSFFVYFCIPIILYTDAPYYIYTDALCETINSYQ